MSQTVYSDEEMLEMLRDCKRKYGKVTPRLFRKDENDYCSVSAIKDRFGSWSSAKEEAGIEEDLESGSTFEQQYTDEEILEDLKEVQEERGQVTPTDLAEYDDKVSPTTVIARFGSWLDAKQQAGIEDARKSNRRPRKYTDEELLDYLRQCQEKHGKVTQRVFDNDEEFPSTGVIRQRFGSWQDAKVAAGVNEDVQTEEYTSEELLKMLRECKEKYEKCTAAEFASHDEFCSPETVQRRFGTWNEAKEQAGVC